MNNDTNKIVNNQLKSSELKKYFMTVITDNMIYQNFFKDVQVVDYTQNEVILSFMWYSEENAMIYNNLFKETLVQGISDVFGKDFKYRIITAEEANLYNKSQTQVADKIIKQNKVFFNNKYSENLTFDTYLVSDFNKETTNICRDIAEGKTDLNILFISGASGIGKTHLLTAIGNRFEELGKKSIYINPIIFNKKILVALQENNPGFISKILNTLTSADIVLFDDFQIFGDGQKKQTKNFIYQIIDARMQSNKPTVISSESDIRDIEANFEERLITRIQSGFLTKIKNPNETEYKDLLEFLLEKNDVDPNIVDDESKEFLVKEFSSSIRTILGVVQKVKYYKEDLVNATYAYSVVKNIFKDQFSLPTNATPDLIIKKVSSYYKVSTREIIGKTRKKEIVIARHICIILMDNLLNMSSTEIGKVLNKDHTTVLNALKKSKNEGSDSSIKLAINQIKREIRTSK
ncbi:helix-turn-helix domain-containing protein [Mycoplasmopsis edwardii]|uniref:DnaA/Hda family protein n=1 Tax=Mycoplasmopsis edwardii TaxID=53558 RepID=A0ACD4PHA3_9BACT|nr:DnaA/Hda family protein [Mycoplasmopsis edwardii]WBP84022.1 DnaA/Hda family protein [Mycoplasmopsis edwardii]